MKPPINERLRVFGEAIKQARADRGLTQVEAAKSIGIDYRHYQDIERGKIDLRISSFLRIRDFYAINCIFLNDPRQGND